MSIRLRSRRGAIGKSWQAIALREALEAILGVGRAAGGKADARAGRVQWLDLSPGRARGQVLHLDDQPYEPTIDLPVLAPGDREALLAVARAHPELPARLAAGEYPQQIEAELARHEVSLLPRGAHELSHDCSCLDWPGPCRHVAALAYVLVEAIDEDPVGLLTLRGLELGDLAPAPAPGGVGAEHGHESGGADEGPGPSAPTDAATTTALFDPAQLDPAPLAAAIGEAAARTIADFYRGGTGPAR